MSFGFAAAVLVKFELYLVLAVSLNLLVGYTGLVSLCQAAFYGVGAYTAALLALHFGWPFPAVLAGSLLVTMALGVVVALPSLRLRDDYLIVATLAFQHIVFRCLYNAEGLTRGPLGLMDLPPARFGPVVLARETWPLLALCSLLAGLTVVVAAAAARSPFGLLLRALRDDEVAVAALGRSVAALKVKAFLLGSAGAAVAGTMLAVTADVLHPADFTIDQSVLILTALIVGGCGNLRGPIVGALFLTVAEELLRYAGGQWGALAGEVNAMVLAIALIVVLRYRPAGLAGARHLG